ncbi:hypothetical protein RRG08_060952 [Elysia crispata]|uniref:Uncharacterized protein n=1 Tax=Elysia crispata TaxID=231223 RepID=A0AAE1E510_9GAST|nr:hypothetical protein RRG08_060952 [Elysia crispata]
MPSQFLIAWKLTRAGLFKGSKLGLVYLTQKQLGAFHQLAAVLRGKMRNTSHARAATLKMTPGEIMCSARAPFLPILVEIKIKHHLVRVQSEQGVGPGHPQLSCRHQDEMPFIISGILFAEPQPFSGAQIASQRLLIEQRLTTLDKKSQEEAIELRLETGAQRLPFPALRHIIFMSVGNRCHIASQMTFDIWRGGSAPQHRGAVRMMLIGSSKGVPTSEDLKLTAHSSELNLLITVMVTTAPLEAEHAATMATRLNKQLLSLSELQQCKPRPPLTAHQSCE